MHVRSALMAVMTACLLTGCGTPRAGEFLLFGSYFPAWLVGTALGIPLTFLVRWVLVRTGIDDQLPLRLLVYVCLTVLFAMAFAYAYSPR
ncbi:MAG: YtcA family lipoprotein [Corticimicrobacter sp.]|uniref:YtcA family lipoprotein n=1 Tax=Corticimicrobacter sp. TaxID=2678536 RepID=UPI0032DBA51D